MVIDESYGYIYGVSMVADVASTRLRDVQLRCMCVM